MRTSTAMSFTVWLLSLPASGAAQASQDTLPERVVARMLDLFDHDEHGARSRLYDSVYYFQDLMLPPAGHPDRPAAMSPEERARRWSSQAATRDPGPPRHRKVLQRMVAGRFVVHHTVADQSP